ncbi:MAG: hypothetical protein EOM05_11495, partial [Clostridia bacterium]|nr:hypothetical protein [Clostridia bacterium]
MNNTPEVPPTDDSIRVQKLVDMDNLPPQEKNPKLTTYSGKEQSEDENTETNPLQPEDLKEWRPTGLKPNVYDNTIKYRFKDGGVKTETTERIRERTPYAEFEQITPAGKVLEQLRLNPPKPTQDSERMRKMAGIQAISEALRNVVDGVYGSQKAVIVPHKTYTNEFLKEAKIVDAGQAKALEKWMKSMNDANKNAMEGYLRYLAQEDKTNIKRRVTTGPQGEIIKEVSEGKEVFAPRSGGGGSKSGGGAGAKVKEITSADTGMSWVLD